MTQRPESRLLPFFPESLPDETLGSRISRYHLLTGNRTDADTLKELFGRPAGLGTVISAFVLQNLAARLPGDPKETIIRLVDENTLLPAFAPFHGVNDDWPVTHDLDLGRRYRRLGRIPQRVNGFVEGWRLCVDCVRDDILNHGIGYWHRSHHVPGVQVCWRHGSPLLAHCPVCRRPFGRYVRLLKIPWASCECGWEATKHSAKPSATHGQQRYAEFAWHLLESRLEPILPDSLIAAFLKKMAEHGFRRKSMVHSEAFRQALLDEFDLDFVRYVDPSIVTPNRSNWFRLTLVKGQSETPLPRHILCAMYLFGDFKTFVAEAVETRNDLPPRRRLSQNSVEPAEEQNPKLKAMRDRVRLLKVQRPALNLETLWKIAYGATDWLFANDRTWLVETLTGAKEGQHDQDTVEDVKLAKIIDEGIDSLYDAEGKPARVTKAKIQSLLPNRFHYSLRTRYPLTQERIDQHAESFWHFNLRRLLYAAGEVRRLQATPIITQLRNFSGTHSDVFLSLLEYFGWTPDELVMPHFDPKPTLVRLGVDRQWPGPENVTRRLGGRNYYRAVGKG
jgi:hypothetical protein